MMRCGGGGASSRSSALYSAGAREPGQIERGSVAGEGEGPFYALYSAGDTRNPYKSGAGWSSALYSAYDHDDRTHVAVRPSFSAGAQLVRTTSSLVARVIAT